MIGPDYTKRQINANRKKWLAALRSGKYKQGRIYLHSVDKKGNHSYCCLGVACELAIKAKVGISFLEASYHGDDNCDHNRYDGQTGVLPKAVANWLGLGSNGGDFYDKNGKSQCLTELNDGVKETKKRAKNFKQLADIIEKNWEGLEKARRHGAQ